MSLKDRFTYDEWLTLQYALLWVLGAVGGADNKVDQKEVEAFAKIIVGAPTYKDELAREVLGAAQADLQSLMSGYKDDPRKIDVGLGLVADILDNKAPEHADGFKQVLLVLAVEIARASGPIFGDKISQDEKLAFAIVARSLRAKID